MWASRLPWISLASKQRTFSRGACSSTWHQSSKLSTYCNTWLVLILRNYTLTRQIAISSDFKCLTSLPDRHVPSDRPKGAFHQLCPRYHPRIFRKNIKDQHQSFMTPKEVPPVVSQGSFHPLAEVQHGCGGKEVEVQHLIVGKKMQILITWTSRIFVGKASHAVPHVRDNESKGTSTIVSGAAKLSLVKARSYGRQSCHVDRQGHIENDKDLTAREMFLPAVERAATGFGSLRSFQDLKVWKSGHYWADWQHDFFGNPFFKAGASHHSRGPTFPNSVCAHVCIVMINTKAKLRKQLLQKAWPPEISRPNRPHATHVVSIVFGPLG